MASARIRRARPDDAAALTACITEAYAADMARLDDLPDMTEGVAEDIAEGHVWVADLAGEVLGGMILIPAPDHLQLANIALRPAARGKGLARSLLSLADAQAVAGGLPELRLATHADMGRNLALYRHMGWHLTGRDGRKVFMARPTGGAAVRFTARLEALLSLLDMAGDTHWSPRLARALELARRDDGHAVTVVLGLFGGAGSFTDFLPDLPEGALEEFDSLQSALYDDARALKKEQ